MNLPGLEESLKEMKLIGGMKMEKPSFVKMESLGDAAGMGQAYSKVEPIEDPFSDSDLIKDFAGHTIILQTKFMEIVDENLRLKKENQRLRIEQQRIREIVGGGGD
jgi:hypothetical protein